MKAMTPTAANTLVVLLLLLFFLPPPSVALDFVLDSFQPSSLHLLDDARISSSVLVLTNDSNQFSHGRAFHPSLAAPTASFSTSFVFSVLPADSSTPGFGLAFVLSNTTSPPKALAGQYFGVFSNATHRTRFPLLAVEFDTGRNPEFGDPDGNHVGIDLNFIESSFTSPAGYYLDSGEFRPLDMRSGLNIRAWIDFHGGNSTSTILVTIAPANATRRPARPLVNYTSPELAAYLAPAMHVGFSASKVTWVERQRVLAWSFSDTGRPAGDLDTSRLPVFAPDAPPPSSSGSLSTGAIAGIAVGAAAALAAAAAVIVYRLRRDPEAAEEWERELWPRRFAYEDLRAATGGFAAANLLGRGGFGRVYRGTLPGGGGEVAVKCVSHESRQGLREFMAEVSSMGRLRHRRLVPMRGWCRRGRELMLVYEYMENGCLSGWIFGPGAMEWPARRRVLADVAEGLLYLHEGWENVVLHRDVKPGNILIDGGMRGRIGDFGLAKVYGRGEAVASTRVVGTLGYLAPELARVSTPTAASDVFSFGVVVLEACTGRRAVEVEEEEDDDFVLVDWSRTMYAEGRAEEMLDSGCRAEGENVEEMLRVVRLGLACCHPDPELRPGMKDVAGLLMGLLPVNDDDAGSQETVPVHVVVA